MINDKQHSQTGDRLAKAIAGTILKVQRRIALILNNQVNRYSKKRQQWVLAIFCGISICGLLLCLFVPFGKIAIQRPHFRPSHIGLPSDLPKQTPTLKPTDPLTNKK